MTAPMELSIAPNIAPNSGTGSDAHQTEQVFTFGDVAVGAEIKSLARKIGESVAIAIIAGLAGKYVMEKLK